MQRLVFGAVGAALMLAASGCASGSSEFASYGEPMRLAEKEQVPVGQVLAAPAQYSDKTILISGVVSEVCEHKGCWIRVADRVGAEGLFVKFTCPVEGRLIPLDSVGQRTLVEGKLIMEEISEEMARHYEEDAGKPPAEVAKIVGPQKRWRLQSPAARVAVKPADPGKPEKG